MIVTLRKFEKGDIPLKVKWINDSANNAYLHYELPLRIDKTEKWFDSVKDRTDRYDAVIEADGVPCGTIGLLGIDRKNKKAEYYVAMGENSMKRNGIALTATNILLNYAFRTLELNKVYLYTEAENLPAQRLFEKAGFIKEGCLKADLFVRGSFIDRFCYGMCASDFKGFK